MRLQHRGVGVDDVEVGAVVLVRNGRRKAVLGDALLVDRVGFAVVRARINERGVGVGQQPVVVRRPSRDRGGARLDLVLLRRGQIGSLSRMVGELGQPSRLLAINGRKGCYLHDSLPGWTYARAEIRTETIPDLEALAERGERSTEVTSGAAA